MPFPKTPDEDVQKSYKAYLHCKTQQAKYKDSLANYDKSLAKWKRTKKDRRGDKPIMPEDPNVLGVNIVATEVCKAIKRQNILGKALEVGATEGWPVEIDWAGFSKRVLTLDVTNGRRKLDLTGLISSARTIVNAPSWNHLIGTLSKNGMAFRHLVRMNSMNKYNTLGRIPYG